jgi:hypothetical protein
VHFRILLSVEQFDDTRVRLRLARVHNPCIQPGTRRTANAQAASGHDAACVEQGEPTQVVLAYWAPVYITVDTTRSEVVSVQMLASGMRAAARVSGQPMNGVTRDAAGIVAAARVEGRLPSIELR